MTRLAVPLTAAIAAFVAAGPVLAADFDNNIGSGTDLRSGYANDWDNSDQDDPLSFELGLRYWYSWGAQSLNAGPAVLTENDTASSAEAHFRVDDASTAFYAKGLAGMSFNINGDSTGGPAGQPSTVSDGRISYAGGDLGYSWLGNGKNAPKFGPFAGYMYWNDSPDTGRAPYSPTPTSGGSEPNDVTINALRLGFSGTANFGRFFDVSGELAAVPYAKVNGTLGAFGVGSIDNGTTTTTQSSAASIDGWGYGAMGEVMVGFHPTDHLTFRAGGRAWYVTGKADTTFDTNTVDDTDRTKVVSSQSYIAPANPFSVFRYGLLAEMTYSF